jgi:hypothetical protein
MSAAFHAHPAPTTMLSLLSLPFDLQILIIPLLDFTSLISLSQTNHHFQHLINPQRQHFIGRLLEIECLPEHGGEIILNPHKVFPPTVRYVCTHCLKVLPHTRFDNHSLLRLRYRKPPPGSRAAGQLCGWTGGDAKAQGLKRQAELKNDTFENWMLEEHPDLFSPTQELKDSFKIGTSRHKRTCNECKFHTGFWARNLNILGWGVRNANQNVGTASVPVIKSRQLYTYHDSSERFFPGLFPYADQFPEHRRIYREYHMSFVPWCLYSIRCPGCERWQELAAFRQKRGYKSTPRDASQWNLAGWEGPKFEEWRCNSCVAALSGEEELGKQLLAFWKSFADPGAAYLDYKLQGGWYYVDCLESDKAFSWEEIYKRARVDSQLLRTIPGPLDIAKMDAAGRKEHFGIWKRYFEEKGQPVHGSLADNPWFRQWTKGYEIMEKRADFLRACTEKVEANPGILVEYALRRDGYKLM